MILINFMIVFGVLYIYIDMNLKCCKSIIYSSYVFYNSVSPNQLKTLSVNCDGPINALDTSKDNSQVVVAGRSGMCIGTYITTNFLSLTTFNMSQPKNKLNSMLHATQQLLNWRRKKRHWSSTSSRLPKCILLFLCLSNLYTLVLVFIIRFNWYFTFFDISVKFSFAGNENQLSGWILRLCHPLFINFIVC